MCGSYVSIETARRGGGCDHMRARVPLQWGIPIVQPRSSSLWPALCVLRELEYPDFRGNSSPDQRGSAVKGWDIEMEGPLTSREVARHVQGGRCQVLLGRGLGRAEGGGGARGLVHRGSEQRAQSGTS